MKRPDYQAKIKTRKSDKVAIDRYKIYRVTDPIQFAELFFPAKNATHSRAEFMAIYFEIKNAEKQKLPTTEHIPKKYDLNPATMLKARTKMVRLGLITKQRYGWAFCSVFKNTLEKLIELIETFKSPVDKASQLEGEKMYVDMAKYDFNKEQKKHEDEFIFGKKDTWIRKDKSED